MVPQLSSGGWHNYSTKTSRQALPMSSLCILNCAWHKLMLSSSIVFDQIYNLSVMILVTACCASQIELWNLRHLRKTDWLLAGTACLVCLLRMVYIGKICMQKCPWYCVVISPSLLALATLGGVTQIGLFLFLVALPKVAKASAVSCRCSWWQRHHYCVTFANANMA